MSYRKKSDGIATVVQGTVPAVSLKEICFRYPAGESAVLDQVSLEIPTGDFVLMAGPSGAGKSTLLKIINGIIPYSEAGEFTGDVRFFGEPMDERTPVERCRKIGTVMQNADEQIIYERVEDELAFPLENMNLDSGEMKERIAASCRQMRLNRTDRTATLSGGEKQRLITAATLGMRQPVLLFDEPLANLDRRGSVELMEHMRELTRTEGATVIFVEHRLDWVLPYATRMVWVEDGTARSFTDREAFLRFWKERRHEELGERDSTPKTAGRPLLTLENVCWKPKGIPVIHDVNFTLREGEEYVVIGDNGSGKSSFLKLLSTLTKPDGGSVQSVYPKKERFRHIGVVMQNPNYQLFMSTVRDEVLFRAADRKLGEEMLCHFGLESLAHRHPHSLSEGQKRKVGVASILAMDPDVLLMDEPTVGQDYRSLKVLLEAVESLRRRHTVTMLTITHDTRCATHFGHRIIRMEEGRIVQTGGPELLGPLSGIEWGDGPSLDRVTRSELQ